MRLWKIWGWMLFALTAPMAGAALAQSAPNVYTRDADALVKEYVDAGRFSGAVLVAKDGRPVFRKAFGLANREWDIPTTPETRFRLGSITKQFTAAAILQLAEQGKLSVDDPVSKYYPAAPPAWTGITVKHLLTHTSGIPSYTSQPDFFRTQSRIDRTPEEIVALTRDMPLEFKPGEKFVYDNTGYILLGYIIEKVSGQTYAAYVRDHVFAPAGLRNTGYDVSEEILPKRAAGYSVNGTTARNAPYLAMTLPYAAGSLYSTVDDLLAWDQALHAGKVLKPASVAAMFTDYGFKYGYGQSVAVENGHRSWGHGGGINGFATFLGRYPDNGLTVVVLSNIQEANAGGMAQGLARLYLEPPRPSAAAPPLAELETYVGDYQLGPRFVLHITRDGDRLVMRATDQPPFPLTPRGGRTFGSNVVRADVIFDAASAGRSPALVLRQAGVDRPAGRIAAAESARIEAQPAPAKVERKEIAIDPRLLDRYVGRYRMNASLMLEITREGDRLFAEATGQPKVELSPESERDFFIKVAPVQMTFAAGDKASEVVVHQGGLDTVAKRID